MYAGFGIGGNTVAECRTITPATDRMQHDLVLARSSAVQNKRAMHSSVGTHNEADSYAQVFVIQNGRTWAFAALPSRDAANDPG